MAFQRAQPIKAELTRDGDNKITKIYLVIQMQDDAIVGTREFDYVIDGGTLDEIRGDLKAGLARLVKDQTRQKYQEWTEQIRATMETKSDLTPLQIKIQLGINDILTL